MNQVRSLLSMHCILLEYNFEPRPNIDVLDIAGSVMNMASIKRMHELKNPVIEFGFHIIWRIMEIEEGVMARDG